MIRELDQERGSTCAADFRDRLNVGRKLAIQILEYFDRLDLHDVVGMIIYYVMRYYFRKKNEMVKLNNK